MIRRRVHYPLLGLAVGLIGVPVTGQPESPVGVERTLVLSDLSRVPMRLVGIDGGTVRGVVDGRVQIFGPGTWAAVIGQATFSDEGESTSENTIRSMIELTDGQRLAGVLLSGGNGEEFWWEVAGHGILSVPLDAVRALCFDGCPDRWEQTLRDVVVLRNGDRLEGFVAAIGDRIELESAGRVLAFDPASIIRVQLAASAQQVEGAMLWLADGQVVRVGAFGGMEGVRFSIQPDWPGDAQSEAFKLSVRIDEAVALVADAAVWAPLASLGIERQGPVAGRRWASPVIVGEVGPAGLADLRLPGPMFVDVPLPSNARRFACEVELPEDSRLWGDCILIVQSLDRRGGEHELGRVRVHGGSPRGEINVALDGVSTLRLVLDPGPGGPIQDRIILRHGVLLLGRSATVPPE
ncbi:MAG: hypothetical protein KF866_12975 [Phycisphaeraceae bacterium]|nr:hypothetical protein [Phycisphaeraceae bacterium]